VTRTANGDKHASDALVERYAPLVWLICRQYQLSGADADDLGLAVCLQLAGQLGKPPTQAR
jgi:DNA-directed RNA polymerase specialized sigma subunit